MEITIPISKRGRRSKTDQIKYNDDLLAFCRQIMQIKSTLDFSVSSRGWCYILEEYGLKKSQFDKAQKLINDCRKNGLLSVDVCATDEARRVQNNNSFVDDRSVEDVVDGAVAYLEDFADNESSSYYPRGFYEYQTYYVELMVEKIDLIGLFAPVCRGYNVPYQNARGYADINGRYRMLKRFEEMEARGLQCVLLYCGDHDPGGLKISDSLRSNLYDLADAAGWWPDEDSLIIDHFGLHYDFIEANNISWIDNLETANKSKGISDLSDPRHPDHDKEYVQSYLKDFGARKVEANALVTRPDAGRMLADDTIIKYISVDGIGNWKADNKAAQTHLKQAIEERMNL